MISLNIDMNQTSKPSITHIYINLPKAFLLVRFDGPRGFD
jgi:hypothetical protein